MSTDSIDPSTSETETATAVLQTLKIQKVLKGTRITETAKHFEEQPTKHQPESKDAAAADLTTRIKQKPGSKERKYLPCINVNHIFLIWSPSQFPHLCF